MLDLAVIGRYPDPNFAGYHENELRTIDIIDVDSEKVVARLHDPSAPGLVCVSVIMAGSYGSFSRSSNLLQQKDKLDSFIESLQDLTVHLSS